MIYIRVEGGVGRSRIVKAIEMRFTLLKRRKKLIIFAATGFTANDVSRSTVHTTLKVSNRARKN